MSAFAMTGVAAPAKIAAKYSLGRNSKALNAKGTYKWQPPMMATRPRRRRPQNISYSQPRSICRPTHRADLASLPNSQNTSQPPFAPRAPRP